MTDTRLGGTPASIGAEGRTVEEVVDVLVAVASDLALAAQQQSRPIAEAISELTDARRESERLQQHLLSAQSEVFAQQQDLLRYALQVLAQHTGADASQGAQTGLAPDASGRGGADHLGGDRLPRRVAEAGEAQRDVGGHGAAGYRSADPGAGAGPPGGPLAPEDRAKLAALLGAVTVRSAWPWPSGKRARPTGRGGIPSGLGR